MYNKRVKHKYIILDRDGTLIKHIPYLDDPGLVEILPNVVEGLKYLSDLGFKFGIISNQSGIGRGKISEDTVLAINKKILDIFNGNLIYIDFTYFCPHSPENLCSCRKPEIALGTHEIRTFMINVSLSYMIGDADVDIKFGRAIGMKTIRVGVNKVGTLQSDYTTIDLLEAAKLIEIKES